MGLFKDRKIRIVVQARLSDNNMTLNVRPTARVKKLKKKILKKTGIKIINQRLFLKERELDDYQGLDDLNIPSGTSLRLVVIPDDAVLVIGKMEGRDQTVVAYVESTLTYKAVKEKLEMKASRVPDSPLKPKKKGKWSAAALCDPDNDSKMLSECNLTRGETIRTTLTLIEPGTIKVFVKTDQGKMIALTLKNSDTIRTLKQDVAKLDNIPADQQLIMIGGKVLEDGKTLAEVGIKEGSTVKMSPTTARPPAGKLNLIIELMSGATVKVVVKDAATVGDLKTKISQDLGTSTAQQRLLYNSKALEEDDRPLSYYQVTKDCKIHLLIDSPVL